MASREASIAANRFGLGARPNELQHMAQPVEWLRRQLQGGAPTLADATLRSSQAVLAGVADLVADRRAAADTGDPAGEGAQQRQQLANRLPRYYRPIYVAESRARLAHGVATDRPFLERLVHFWSNHFAVSIDKVAVLGLAGTLEREAIRPHVLGRFHELLRAVEQHPAMLLYLDNQLSVGPQSPFATRAGQRGREVGLNENLAREILELHTLGVDGGYTQADVTSFARIITGWSISGARGVVGRRDGGEPGRFLFRELVHEPGAHAVMGKRYTQQGVAQGEAVLRDLASSPATARHIATKLARHFIADDPPPSAVQRLASVFLDSGGELTSLYRALIDMPECWSAPLAKYKTPTDYVLSIYRGLALPVPENQQALAAFELLGQRQFMPGSPAGWPDRSADWDGAAALMKRIEFAAAVARRVAGGSDAVLLAPQLLGTSLDAATRTALARAADPQQALTLLLTAPEFMRR